MILDLLGLDCEQLAQRLNKYDISVKLVVLDGLSLVELYAIIDAEKLLYIPQNINKHKWVPEHFLLCVI